MAAIGILCTDPTGGVAHYRAGSLGTVLRARGHTVVVSDQGRTTPAGSLALMLAEGNDPEGRVAGWEPDVVILTGGWPCGAPLEMLDEARAEGQRVVLDIDDSLEIPEHNYHYDPELKNAKLWAARAHCDAVLVSTRPIARELRRGRVRVPIVESRNVVELERFKVARELNDARAIRYDHAGENPAPFTLAWRGSVPHHRGDVALLTHLAASMNGRLGVRWVHIGAQRDDEHAFARAIGVPQQHVEPRPLVPFGMYPALLTGVDLAVVPLEAAPFSRAKSNVAGLEWAAAGVPFVSSWNEAYDAFSGGIPGTLARNVGELERFVFAMLEPMHRYSARATQRYALEAPHPEGSRAFNWTTAAAIGLESHPVEELLERLRVPDARGQAAPLGGGPVDRRDAPADPQRSPHPGGKCK